MKKILALVLCLALSVSLFAGCGGGGGNEETKGTLPNVVEGEKLAADAFAGTTLKVAVLRKAEDASTDHNEKEGMKLVAEATGIDVEWIYVDPAASADKLANMLMGDDQPDVYLGFFATDENTLASNLDLFYDLSEEGLLETYAPDIYEQFNANPLCWTVSTWGDGAIYGLPTGSYGNGTANGGAASFLAINQEWLDKAGKKVPTTADELYDVLKYFKNNDMDGDGDPTNEIPMTFANGYSQADLMMYASAFGIAGNYTWQAHDHYKNIKDDKVVSTMDTENYRAFLEFFHKLYSEGLLDVEGFSQTSDQYQAKRKAKTCGVVSTYATMLDEGYTPFVYQGMKGVTPMISGLVGRFGGLRSNFCITADSLNVEAALHWWNYMHTDSKLKHIIQTGSDYFIQDGDKFIANPDYQETGKSAYTEGLSNFGPLLMPEECYTVVVENLTPANQERFNYLEDLYAKKPETFNVEGFPLTYTDIDVMEERASIELELYNYLGSFTATSISDGLSDAQWNAHLKALETYRYYDWLDSWQDQVDAAGGSFIIAK